MHEASLMKGVMAKILDLAEEEGGRAVSRVSVWLGALSHMSPAHFREHYDQSAAGTMAAAADLDIELSEDVHHRDALHVVLKSIDVTT